MEAASKSVAPRIAAFALPAAILVHIVSGVMLAAEDAEDETAASPATVAEVFATWAQRESGARRFCAEWIHERTYTKFWANCHVPFARDEYVTLRFGASRLILDGDRLRFDAGGVDEGAEAATIGGALRDSLGRSAHDDARRVFRDDRIRYDAGRPRVDPREAAPTDWPRNLRPFTTVFDGQRNLQFLPADHGHEAEAYRFAGAENRFRESLHYLPLVLAVRPSWLGGSPDRCRIEPAPEVAAGRECCVLIDEAGLRREFWLDAERDFSVVSYREECDVLGARMKNRIDISYVRDANGEWLPAAWTTVFYDNRGLMEQYAPATVLTTTTEPTIGAETFTVDFPVGTWVFDEADARHHIVGAAGQAEPISNVELRQGMSHAELIARTSWSGQAERAARSAWGRTWVRFVVFVALFGGASAWLQRRFEPRMR